MSFDLLEHAAFGVYEIFSNLIPGSLVVMTIAVSPQFSFLTLAGNGFLGAFLGSFPRLSLVHCGCRCSGVVFLSRKTDIREKIWRVTVINHAGSK